MALKVWCRIVFLYNYSIHIWCIKMGDGYGFWCLLKQVEIDVQSTSNRKLPNFYEKVTDFLWESYRISKWWQNSVLTEAWRDCHNQRVLTYYTNWIFIQTMRLFMHSCRLLMLFNLKWFLLSLKLLIGCDGFCVFLEICEKKSDVFESVTVFLYLWNGGFYWCRILFIR